MKVQFNVYYNYRGRKLTEKKIHSFILDVKEMPETEEERTKIVHSQVPLDLVEKYTVEPLTFENIKPGDLVKIHWKGADGMREKVQVVHEVHDGYFQLGSTPFDFTGHHIGYYDSPSYVTHPTEKEVQEYIEANYKATIIKSIKKAVNNADIFLKSKNELKEIYRLLTGEDFPRTNSTAYKAMMSEEGFI